MVNCAYGYQEKAVEKEEGADEKGAKETDQEEGHSQKEAEEEAVRETGGEESVHERAERRSSVVTPLLTFKRWKRGKWAARAGVSKNSVYDYLNGKRNLSFENRQALAEVLELKPEGLPD